jgi:viologen exporter family transport system ATP-binding protein
MTLIRARELTKRYRVPVRRPGALGALRHLIKPISREHIAVDRLTLEIDEGESVAYLGRNGAGKSTTLKMMTGILVPSAGEITVAGIVPHAERTRHVRGIGAVFGQRSQLWLDLPVSDSFGALREIYGVPRAEFAASLRTLTELLELGPLLATPARKLSLGQRMRADLAAALLHRPRVLFLDEPTIGLDIEVKARIRGFVRELVERQGVTVMLTTHDLADIEGIAERVTVIDAGRLIFDGDKQQLVATLGDSRAIVFALGRPIEDAQLDRLTTALLGEATVISLDAESIEVTLPASATIAPVVTCVLGICEVVDITIDEPNIEGVIRRIYADGSRAAEPREHA